MCGIAGYWATSSDDRLALRTEVETMLSRIRHRGPDAGGLWMDSEQGIALGHRRLSIVDLSELGAQPMCSESGRFVISFNGEIYNYLELRLMLEARGICFRGHSDTEILVNAISELGLAKALELSDGMYAFALWDRKENTVTLARDRFGEKPLYYYSRHGRLIFASELKAIEAIRSIPLTLDENSLSLYLRYNYVPGPGTLYRDVYSLPPASIVRFCAAGASGTISQFWALGEMVAEKRAEGLFSGSLEDATFQLNELMAGSIRQRLQADVPVGVLLSGGIDSSLIMSYAAEYGQRSIEGFTVDYADAQFDEGDAARRVADSLGVRHHRLVLEQRDVLSTILQLGEIYDEPLGDTAQVPSVAISRFARGSVTVALTGDGGDELFGGYNTHMMAQNRLNQLGSLLSQGNVPPSLRSFVSRRLRSSRSRIGRRVWLGLSVASHSSPTDIYDAVMGVGGASKLATHLSPRECPSMWTAKEVAQVRDVFGYPSDLGACFMFLDTKHYLPDALLVKVDRASMAFGLECRAPFLGKEIAEFAWRLPNRFKSSEKYSKLVLRNLLASRMPSAPAWKEKKGFDFPIGKWLRGPLQEWARSLLGTQAILAGGALDPGITTKFTTAFFEGRIPFSANVWSILMLQAWLTRTKARRAEG
jgi:asparagine synthase (glutamine-hydrolysing)